MRASFRGKHSSLRMLFRKKTSRARTKPGRFNRRRSSGCRRKADLRNQLPKDGDRRSFLRVAAASALSAGRILGANDRIRVGVIGTGGRGRLLMGLFKQCVEAEIVAVCDVYE